MESIELLSFGEAELIVENLSLTKLEKFGGRDWKKQHDYLVRLNQQAQINAQSNTTEFVSELCATKKVMEILMHELITCEIWRHHVIPIIIKTKQFNPMSTLPFYTSLYNEAVIVNILETILYSTDVCEALDEYAVDLVEYCYRTISLLLSLKDIKSYKLDELGQTPKEVHDRLIHTTLLEYGPKCISIIRYLSESNDRVPLETHSKIIEKLNYPQLLVELLDNDCPWIKQDTFYQSGKWQKSDKILNPHQLGLLLLLRQIMCSDGIKNYEFHSQNVSSLMRIQKYLTPNVLDFCSPLADLSNVLSQIQMGAPEPIKRAGLIIEAEPEIRSNLEKLYSKSYPAIAKNAMKIFLNPSEQKMKEEAKEFMKNWDFDTLEQLIDEAPKCEKCGQEAVNRCGKCKRAWYCRRQCQVEDWKSHKKMCSLLRQN